MKKIFIISLILFGIIIIGCSSTKDINKTVENIAWESLEYLPKTESKTVAVYYFTHKGEPHSLSDYIINGISSHLSNAIKEEELNIKIVSRQALDKIIKELKFQLGSLADQDTQVEIGKQLGADIIVTGQVNPIENELYNINAQIIDIETGRILGGIIYDFWWEGE